MSEADPAPDPARRTTRRTFLRGSAAAVSAAALSRIDVAGRAHAAGSDVIRVGLIGCGGRGTGAAEQALGTGPDVRLVAMADLFEDRLRESLEQLRAEKPDQVEIDGNRAVVGFDGWRRVIEASDVVLIACASKFHPRYVRAAVEAGKHVFVEKPHAIDPAGVKEVAAASDLARKKGLSLVSGLHSRYTPGMQEAMRRVHDGAVGDIVAIEENFLRGPYRLVPRPPGQREIEYQFYNWYHFRWLSGDDVVQSLVHNLDRSLWAMNGKTPKRAVGLGGRSASFGGIHGDVFDHHSVIYEFDGGVRVYAHCRTQERCANDYSTLILGTKGRARISGFGECAIEGETKWRSGPPGDGHRIEQERLFAAVRSGTPLHNGDYMTASTLAAVMGQIACWTGQEVTWDQVAASDAVLAPADGDFSTEPPVRPDPDGQYPVPVPGVTKFL